ncbi:MAG: hypothetical protein EOO06_13350 [Chitinophagaceae bacterium]|nr:MAG: hypothetical protein EOO06_13350 [Chitinophagaceae bacterium]
MPQHSGAAGSEWKLTFAIPSTDLPLDNSFEITFHYKGKPHSVEAVFITTAFSYRIDVDLFGSTVSYEPDEERNFRAVLQQEEGKAGDPPDRGLVVIIGDKLEEMFRD